MAKKNNKKPHEEKHKRARKAFEIPAVGIIDNIILTRKEAWAYFQISEKPYLFLSTPAKVQLANSTISSLGGICQSANKKVDCHLLISTIPFDPSAWEDDLLRKHYAYSGADVHTNHQAFLDFIKDQADSLYEKEYQKRVAYLGVKIAQRGAVENGLINPLEFGFKEAYDSFKKAVNALFVFNEFEITSEEEKKMRQLEETLYNALSSSGLQARRPSSEDLLLLIKRRLYPAMPTPFLETDYENRVGLSDITLETGSEIEEKARYVKITQISNRYELTGYRATLSFSKFPKELMFPSNIPPFLHKSIMLPFTANCRFSLIPTENMKKDLYKKQLDTDDEINNLLESGQKATESLKATVKDQAILEKDLEEENLPWISGNYRITVEAPTEEDIRAMVENLKQDYSEHDFTLTWTSGDQLDLLQEEMPGGVLKMKDFAQTTNLALLGLAGINYGGAVGDPVMIRNRTSLRKRGD